MLVQDLIELLQEMPGHKRVGWVTCADEDDNMFFGPMVELHAATDDHSTFVCLVPTEKLYTGEQIKRGDHWE